MVHNLKKYGIYPALIYMLFVLLTSCNKKYHTFEGSVWGTSYHITYCGNEALADSAIVVMAMIDNQLSMFNPQSTISKINAGQDSVATDMLCEIFELSKKVNHLSSGAFDPTVGPLTNLWGFGTSGHDSRQIPTQCQIDSALTLVGIGDCHISARQLVKKNPATIFDFSSIAKGFGIDKIGDMLRRNGCKDFMIEIGGEVLSSGLNPKGDIWKIQIDAPTSGVAGHDALRIITLHNSAVATSGNYRNFHQTSSGTIAHHTIDPSTGRPARSATLSASVIAPDCASADALATASMVMDADKALQMIQSLDLTEALLVVNRGDSIAIVCTPGFPAE